MTSPGGEAVLPEPRLVLPRAPLDERQSLLATAVGAAGIGTFHWDLVTGALTWDDQLLALFGYGPETTDRSIDAFSARLHSEDAERVHALMSDAIDAVGEYRAEYRIVLPGGEQRWIAARGRALAGEAGTAAQLIGAAWDISTRREAQDRLAQLVEEMAIGFIAMDADWVMTHANAEAERVTGTARERLLGRTLWDAFPAAVGTDFEHNYRRAAATGIPVVFEGYYPEPLDVWVEVRAVPATEGLALYFFDITERRRAQELSDQVAEREKLLYSVTEKLSATLDGAEAARRLTRLVVPRLADWCVVTLLDDGESGDRRAPRDTASWHRDPPLRDTVAAYARARPPTQREDPLVVRAMVTGTLQVLDRGATVQALATAPDPARDLLHRLAPESIAVMPLAGRNGPVGVLTLGVGSGRGGFADADLETARYVAARAGVVLDNARLYRQQRHLAESFQRSLLTPPPEPDHTQIVVRYIPAVEAAEVGGDWYDALVQPSGSTVLVIGDVVGHDVQAAAAMGQVRTMVRTLAAHDHEGPAAVLRDVEQVMQTLQAHILATAVVARLEQTPEQRAAGLTDLRWSNAGHPPPMVVLPDGRVQVLDGGRPDMLLGVRPDAPRREGVVTLPWGSVVLLYTDGLVESRHEHVDAGLDRLTTVLGELAGRDLDDLCDQVLARMLPTNPGDDVALVAVELHPQDRPRPWRAGPNRVPPGVPEG
jgi:PAS domain S-box-containing protein